jgi:maleate isomerase
VPDTLAFRAILGVLVPDFNTTVQPELESLRPTGVTNQTARFTLDADVLQNVVTVAEKLKACGPDVLLVGLSTEMFPGGIEVMRQGAADVTARTGLPVVTAPDATQAALRALGVRRLGIVTPFDADGNAHVRAAFEAEDFTVVAIDGLACPSFDAIPRATADDVRRVCAAVDRPGVEALVQVGTGLPVVALIDALERVHGKAVVACNAALYWQALRAVGIADPMPGFGRLLAGA